MINGEKQEIPPAPKKQVVYAGAVVHLNDGVLTHGILLHHPELPPFKLFLSLGVNEEGVKCVTKYQFDLVQKEDPTCDNIEVVVIDTAKIPQQSGVIVPEKKLIMPGD